MKLLCIIPLLIITASAGAQHTVSGTITNKKDLPVFNANIDYQ